MLRARGDVEALIAVEIVGVGIFASIVWIGVIYDGMGHININASQRVDDMSEAAQTYPGVAINGDAIVTLNGLTSGTHTILKFVCVTGTKKKRLIDLMHTTNLRHIDPRIAGN